MKIDIVKLGETTFGRYLRDLRVKRQFTLRDFCLRNMIDAGNQSKLERGILSPPRDMEHLMFYATALSCSPKEIAELSYLCKNYHVSELNEEFGYL